MIIKKVFIASLCLLVSGVVYPGTTLARKSITVAMWAEGQTLKDIKAVVDVYSKKKGIEVKIVTTNWDNYLDKVLTLAAAGKVPDVVIAERRFVPTFVKAGLLRPLDDVIKAEKFDPQSQLTFPRFAYYDGQFYGFPIQGGPHLMTYNPSLFTKAGVQDPNSLTKAGRWTWDTFVDVGRKLSVDTNGDGKLDQFGLASLGTFYEDWVAKIRQNGGDVVDEKYTKAIVDQPAAIEGLTFWRDLAYRYNIAPKPDQGGNMPFSTGKSAMWYNWAASTPYEKATYKGRIDMQIALQPAGKAGYAVIAGANPIGVSRSSKNWKDAYDFAKWYALESDFWKITGAPASKKTFNTEYHTFLSTNFKYPETVALGIENGRPEPIIHLRFRLLEEAIVPAINKLKSGKSSPEEAAKTMAASINRILKMK